MSNALKGRAAVLESSIESRTHAISEPDPVFAAIAARRETLSKLIAAAQAHDVLWVSMPPAAKQRPCVMAAGSAAFDHKEIDDLIETSIGHLSEKWSKFLDPAQLERTRAECHAKLDAESEALTRIQDEFGYTAVKARFDAALAADNEALRIVCRVTPSTLRGIATLSGWVNEKFEDLASLDDGKALAEVLTNLKQSVRALASRAQRISSLPSAS